VQPLVSLAALATRRRSSESGAVGKFIIGILVGIVIVIVVLVQCTRAIF
jgi:hypothetical protein